MVVYSRSRVAPRLLQSPTDDRLGLARKLSPMPRVRRELRAERKLYDKAAFSQHTPERIEERRFSNVGRRVVVNTAGPEVTDRNRLQVAAGVDDRLQQRTAKR